MVLLFHNSINRQVLFHFTFSVNSFYLFIVQLQKLLKLIIYREFDLFRLSYDDVLDKVVFTWDCRFVIRSRDSLTITGRFRVGYRGYGAFIQFLKPFGQIFELVMRGGSSFSLCSNRGFHYNVIISYRINRCSRFR